MGLKFGSKYTVRFEWTDGEVESTVSLIPGDDEATLVRKLKRIVALVEGPLADRSMQHAAHVGTMLGMDPNTFRKALPVAAEPPQLGPEQAANGWELLAPDDLEDAPGESG